MDEENETAWPVPTFNGGRFLRRAAVAAVCGSAVAIAVMMLGGLKSTPPDMVALHYTGGPLQGVHFKSVVPPGTGTRFVGLLEHWYEYPTTERNYIVSDVPSESDRGTADAVKTTSSDSVEADWNVTISFKLNTTPSVIRAFHEELGLKFHAWTHDGWVSLLDQTLRQVLDNKMNAEASRYPIAKLYSDPAVRQTIQDAVGADLKAGVNALLGGEFFCGPTFDPVRPGVCPDLEFIVKGRPGIPDAIKAQYESNLQAQLAVAQKDAEVEQARKQAEAAKELSDAIANNPAYVELQAIQSGKVTFWILPQSQPLTLPAPR